MDKREHVDAVLRFSACSCSRCDLALFYSLDSDRSHKVRAWVQDWLVANNCLDDLIIMYSEDSWQTDIITLRVRLRSKATALRLKLAFVPPPAAHK